MGTLVKRPFIMIFFSFLALVLCLIGYYFPVSVFNILFATGTYGSGEIFQSIVYLLQLVLKLAVTSKGLLVALLFLVAGSLSFGLIFSGFFNLINNALSPNPKFKGEFNTGIKNYFIKISLMTFAVLLAGLLFAVFLLVASVPALVVTNAAFTGKPQLYITAVLVDFITLGVVFFSTMFFRIYVSFWYPSVFNNRKKAFALGKRTADARFWGIVGRFIALDLIFVLFQILFSLMGSSIIAFAGKWIFYSLFMSFVITYIFALFKTKS